MVADLPSDVVLEPPELNAVGVAGAEPGAVCHKDQLPEHVLTSVNACANNHIGAGQLTP